MTLDMRTTIMPETAPARLTADVYETAGGVRLPKAAAAQRRVIRIEQ